MRVVRDPIREMVLWEDGEVGALCSGCFNELRGPGEVVGRVEGLRRRFIS